MKALIKRILGYRIIQALRILLHGDNGNIVWSNNKCFNYDMQRYIRYSAATNPGSRESIISRIVIRYHAIEKGLTMPNMRLGFGKNKVGELMQLIDSYQCEFHDDNHEVAHAIGVVREYWTLHERYSETVSADDAGFWCKLHSFSDSHKNINPTVQTQIEREVYYSTKHSPFLQFAWSRHSVRHYDTGHIPIEHLMLAVDLARSTPSACNRQHCRTHVIKDKSAMGKLLEIQGGNRGFGHLADTLLVVTSDLTCVIDQTERNDIYINGGMYLMNLCYALHFYEIAHCVLNWSVSPQDDIVARKVLPIKPSETIIALLSCGLTPRMFDIAESPRKPLGDYLVVHE